MRPDPPALWLERRTGFGPRDIHLGLDRVRAVHGHLGSPCPAPVVVTVAGTNGKGSCIALLDSILRAGGYRVGCYTSPHLLRLAERIRIDGVAVADAAVLTALERVDRARNEVPLTWFEFVTLAALLILAEDPPDVALLEVGLGGRLDAVNIIDADVAVIARIALDHQDRLGPDREAIGGEKAGILRAGRPAVCGDAEPPASVLRAAEALTVPLAVLGRDYGFERTASGWHWHGAGRRRLSLPPPALRGVHQFDNAATALMALELLAPQFPVDQRAVRSGMLNVRLPGRMTVVGGSPTWILDVAHNRDAVTALRRTLGQQFASGATHALLGMLSGRDVADCIAPLCDIVDHWHLATLDDERALSADRLRSALPDDIAARSRSHASVADAVVKIKQGCSDADRVVVFGSFVTVGEAMHELGV